ncbi:DsbA family protein [Paenibacillus melissococcoides]|uniref:DsbA family protein n=1 Tax=Paenibacillus melissococcoides TaxID=2912268 RepID=A0ABM9G0B9_9BACL|nr:MULTISPECIES: DsbA family protein [Paenibacillus]MEB9895191.1 DsbA family protein [Bacillus cereus]CAH8244996.1 DsbA family protein [Paenibacillus melissococcoides]CAH8709591.1 DsbA family protein [Paenibacillus melissococcoides]CAH8710318.1 DsbA family protein [Paenibacillus melissococcoides]
MAKTTKHRPASSSRKGKKGNDRAFLLMIPIAIVVLGVLIYVLNQQGEKMKQEEMANQPPVEFNIEGQPTLGNADAAVSIVEFGDYKCPACKIWNETIFPQLKADYIDTGKVKFTFLNKLVIARSDLAAEAAEEVYRQQPEAFWSFHHELYRAQQDEGKDWATAPFLVDFAQRTVPDLDTAQLEKALQDRTMRDEVTKDEQQAAQARVNSTPTLFVNGVEFTGHIQDYEGLKAMIDKALEQAK